MGYTHPRCMSKEQYHHLLHNLIPYTRRCCDITEKKLKKKDFLNGKAVTIENVYDGLLRTKRKYKKRNQGAYCLVSALSKAQRKRLDDDYWFKKGKGWIKKTVI